MKKHELKHIPTYQLIRDIELIANELRIRDRVANKPKPHENPVLNKSFEELYGESDELDSRVYNGIIRHLNMETPYRVETSIYHVLQIDSRDLYTISNLGKLSRNKLLQTLTDFCVDNEINPYEYPIFK